MKKVFFLTTVFAVVVSIFLLSSCGHSSGGGGSHYDATLRYTDMNFDTEETIDSNEDYAGKLNAYCFTGNVSKVVDFLTYTVNADDYKCDCGENCTCCITEIKIKVEDTSRADRDSLVEALNKVPEGKTVYLDIHCTYINASDAFKGCASLSGLVLAAHHEKIGEKDFNNCKNLEKVYFSDRVTSVEKNPFYGCDKLTEIGVDESSTYFSTKNGVLYDKSGTTLLLYPAGEMEECTLDNSTTTIGSYAFYGTKVKKVILNESLAVIEPNAFSGSNVTEVVFTGDWVMSNNAKTDSTDPSKSYNLHEVSVEDASNAASLLKEGTTSSMYWYSIGNDKNFTVEGSTDISSHYFKGNVAEAVDYINSLSSVNDTTNYVYFVSIVDSSETSTKNLRAALRGLSATASTGPYVSLDLTEATALDLSGSYAFQGTSSSSPSYALREVKLPENCTSIGSSAFSHQAGLQNVVLPEVLESLGIWAFYKCSALESIDLSNTKITEIAMGYYPNYGVFSCCSSLTKVDLSGCTALESIGSYTFYSCSSLTEVNLSECTKLERTGGQAFCRCSALKTVDLSGCVALKEVSSSFEECSSLKTINLSECTELQTIKNFAFSECSSLEKVDLSQCTELQSIGCYAFYGCTYPTRIKITKTEGYAWGHPSSINTEEPSPNQSNLEMVIDFEENTENYLIATGIRGYEYCWYKVEYKEE